MEPWERPVSQGWGQNWSTQIYCCAHCGRSFQPMVKSYWPWWGLVVGLPLAFLLFLGMRQTEHLRFIPDVGVALAAWYALRTTPVYRPGSGDKARVGAIIAACVYCGSPDVAKDPDVRPPFGRPYTLRDPNPEP